MRNHSETRVTVSSEKSRDRRARAGQDPSREVFVLWCLLLLLFICCFCFCFFCFVLWLVFVLFCFGSSFSFCLFVCLFLVLDYYRNTQTQSTGMEQHRREGRQQAWNPTDRSTSFSLQIAWTHAASKTGPRKLLSRKWGCEEKGQPEPWRELISAVLAPDSWALLGAS